MTTSLILFAVIQFSNVEVFSSTATTSLIPDTYTLTDGVYRAQAVGYENLVVDLEIEIVNQEIVRITLFDSGCTEEDRNGIYLIAANRLVDEILSSNSADVDIITGATHTSEGIIEAVEKLYYKL
ncbi:MAG: FMN-binding protein [Firmicutes bacterium]|nr:FMN-binding protein [Bacillota bacterium]